MRNKKKERMRRLETAEMRLLRTVVGYRMIGNKCNESIIKEQGITYIVIMNKYQNKWLEYLERMPENRISKVLCQ
jgi:hypothetical protein